jgi:hypothetical protein
MNLNAISLLEKNQNKICWRHLSMNPNAIHLLEKNLDKIDWSWLSRNENAIHLLEKNKDKINWECLSINPNIFTLDYVFIKERMNIYKEELIMAVFHPIRFSRYLDMGYNLGDDMYEEN